MRSSITAATFAAATTLFVPLTSAHGFVTGVTVNGEVTPGSDPVWFYHPDDDRPVTAGWDALNQDLGFVAPDAYGTADIACHIEGTPGQIYINANPGDTLTFEWNTWPDSHKGPIIDYVAPCDGECSAASAGDLKFTKISERALVGPDTWVTDELIENDFTTSMTLPDNLASGNYVLRHEIIALHGATAENGAQNYPQCLNLKVGGSGTAAPSDGVAGTELYASDDAGILFDVYSNPSEYPMPGPPLWTP